MPAISFKWIQRIIGKKWPLNLPKKLKNWIDSGIIGNESLFGERQWSAYSVSRYIPALVVTASDERRRVSVFKNGNVDVGVTKDRLIDTITSAYYNGIEMPIDRRSANSQD
ncbi:hypothetical protein Ddc_21087 [Ditylenchus destructor]|nr:hypothetical protein Ddc_21087 [Ditylenchus destructor]